MHITHRTVSIMRGMMNVHEHILRHCLLSTSVWAGSSCSPPSPAPSTRWRTRSWPATPRASARSSSTSSEPPSTTSTGSVRHTHIHIWPYARRFTTAFNLQKRNGRMDPDDFRACLISMGYDLVSDEKTLYRYYQCTGTKSFIQNTCTYN